VMIVCNRYLQRLNAAMRNWIANLRSNAAGELIIATSREDDGVREYIAGLQAAFPNIRLKSVECSDGITKLQYSELMVEVARGRVYLFWDADMVVPPRFLEMIGTFSLADNQYAWMNRRFLTRPVTYEVITGYLDTLDEGLFSPDGVHAASGTPLERVLQCPIRNDFPQGYCQIYTAATFERADGFGDVEVTEGRFGVYSSVQLRRMQGLGLIDEVVQLDGAVSLHLWHGEDENRANWDGAATIW